MRHSDWRVPHERRVWRLETELKEDGILSESESKEEEAGSVTESEGSEETHWGSEESEEESETADSDDFDDERDWFLENQLMDSLPQ